MPNGFWSQVTADDPIIIASWTQAGGSPYYAVTVAASFCSTDGSTATGTAYITNSVGPGTTTANQIATTAVSTTRNCSTDPTLTTAPTTIFTNLTLPAGTYHLVLNETSANMAWSFENTATTTETTGTGVTSNVDAHGSANAYPPATTPTTFGSPNRGLLFSVTGTAGTPPLPPSTVPALGTFGMIGTGMLLGFSGLLFLKRQPANPLR